jgi:Amt family ammonium transporter
MLRTGLNRLAQLGVQTLGTVVCFAWTFGLGYFIVRLINCKHPLRVSAEGEQKGLNIPEHGGTTQTVDQLMPMSHQAQSEDLHHRVPIEPFPEVGRITAHSNRMLNNTSVDQSLLEHRVEARTVELSEANLA